MTANDEVVLSALPVRSVAAMEEGVSERRIMLPNGRSVTEAEAHRAAAAMTKAFQAFAMEAQRIVDAFATWHREAFEPYARRYMQRRLVRVLRAELERRRA